MSFTPPLPPPLPPRNVKQMLDTQWIPKSIFDRWVLLLSTSLGKPQFSSPRQTSPAAKLRTLLAIF